MAQPPLTSCYQEFLSCRSLRHGRGGGPCHLSITFYFLFPRRNTPNWKHFAPNFNVFPITDCRSLYDALQRLSASLAEKRVILDLVAIRETCGGGMESSSSVRWVPSDMQWADALTKRDKNLRDKFARFCEDPAFCLVELS